MSTRTVYHVVPNNGHWDVKQEHVEQAESSHKTKDLAIDHARERAKSCALGQVIIHKQDGKIETEYTYGADPYPPAG